MALWSLVLWPHGERTVSAVGWTGHPFWAPSETMNLVFGDLRNSLELVPPSTGEDRGVFAPRLALSETDSEIRIEAELPGVEEKDLEVTLLGQLLTLKGEKREESRAQSGEARHVERAYGRFERTLELSCEVEAEKVSAKFRNGVLTVTLPKAASAPRNVRRIEVHSS